MSKKNFSGGLNSLLGGKGETQQETPQKPPVKAGRGRPKKEENEKGTRATLIIKNDNLEKLKAIAYWERITIKQVVNEALENYIKKYEKNKGEVKPKPGR